ncbi:MAG: hypothetical protein PUE63_11560 [Lachnospiraceae bacterium]|nr:hypothetical protein [Lachnospiraceae bacterium]
MKFRIDDTRRLWLCLFGVLFMGVFVSLLIETGFGQDPFSFFNLALSARVPLTFGTCELLGNAIMFVFVFLRRRDFIGIGTLANMIFIGYISDFCRWIYRLTLPEGFFMGPARVPVFLITILGFVFACALYMNADLGVAPYDALPIMLTQKLKKIPFRFVRMAFDFTVIGLGMLLGGHPTIGNILIALLLGPVVSCVGGVLSRTVLRPRDMVAHN